MKDNNTKKNFFSDEPDIEDIKKMDSATIKDLIMWSEGEINDYNIYIEMLKDELLKRKELYWCDLTEEEAEKEAGNDNTKIEQCKKFDCDYCYGDRNY